MKGRKIYRRHHDPLELASLVFESHSQPRLLNNDMGAEVLPCGYFDVKVA